MTSTLNSNNVIRNGLNTCNELIQLSVYNITNADNKNFKKVEANVVTSPILQGPIINGLYNAVNENALRNFRENISIEAQYEVLSDIYQRTQDKLAQPGQMSILDYLGDFSNSLNNLSLNAADENKKSSFISSANSLANYINALSDFCQEQRLELDYKIAEVIQNINQTLQDIQNLVHQKIVSSNQINKLQLENEIDAKLNLLSKYIPISYYYDGNGFLNISVKNNGSNLLSNETNFLTYTPNLNKEAIINNEHTIIYNNIKFFNGQDKKIIFLDNSTNNESIFMPGGVLVALMEAKDKFFIDLQKNLNQIGLQIAKAVNNVNNQAVLPVNYIQGDKAMKLTDTIIGNGTVKIYPLNNNGKALQIDNSKLTSLQLNLDQFTTNGVQGSFNVKGLINEINDFFESLCQRVEMNGLYNLTLNSTSSDIKSFDFGVIAYTEQPNVDNITLTVDSVKCVDNNNNPINVILEGKSCNIGNGDQIRTGNQGLKFTLQNDNNIDYPYKISVNMSTTVNGVVTQSKIIYTIEDKNIDNLNGILNKRFTPTSTSNGKIVTINQSPVKAALVNNMGKKITDPNEEGYLSLSTTISNAYCAIDQYNSKIKMTNNAEQNGFNSIFGMNNFFVGDIKNMGATLAVNSSILNNNNHFSLAQATPDKVGQLNQVTPDFFWGVGIGNTAMVPSFQKIFTNNMDFNLSNTQINTNLLGACSNIINNNNMKTITVTEKLAIANQQQQQLENTVQAFSGVDTDEVMINFMNFANQTTILYKCQREVFQLLQALCDTF